MIVSQWFWDGVDSTGGPNSCWPWKAGARSAENPYGRLHMENRAVAAHRFSLILAKGPPTRNNDQACHTCDNPICCNPAHLWWGSAAENAKDCSVKGRKAQPHRRIIDRVDALQLREQGWSYAMIAAKYGVNQTSVGRALRPLGKGGQIKPNQHPLRARHALALSKGSEG